jgi:hypothetical protein
MGRPIHMACRIANFEKKHKLTGAISLPKLARFDSGDDRNLKPLQLCQDWGRGRKRPINPSIVLTTQPIVKRNTILGQRWNSNER